MADSVTSTDAQRDGCAPGGALLAARASALGLNRKYRHADLLGKLVAEMASESTADGGWKSCRGWFASSLHWQLTLQRSSPSAPGADTQADELYRALALVLERDPEVPHD